MEWISLLSYFFFIFVTATFGQDKTEIGNHVINFYRGSLKCKSQGINLEHGKVKIKLGGKLLHFICDRGFTIIGYKMSACIDGEWSHSVPVCAAKGCKMTALDHPSGVIEKVKLKLENEVVAYSYSCKYGYHFSAKSDVIYCNGKIWKGSRPLCIKLESVACDFENMTSSGCNWTNDDINDLDWRHHSEETLMEGTGPDFDHTFNTEGKGHYMYVDSSDIEPGTIAKLNSPWIYPEQDWCISYWYHMYGDDMEASLVVSIQTEKESRYAEFEPLWMAEGSQGNLWKNKQLQIPKHKSRFKVIFQATLNASDSSDIAIDDVIISPCHDMPTVQPNYESQSIGKMVTASFEMLNLTDLSLVTMLTSESDSDSWFSTQHFNTGTADKVVSVTNEENDFPSTWKYSGFTIPTPQRSYLARSKKLSKVPMVMGLVGGSVAAVVGIVLIICFVIKRRHRNLYGEEQDMRAFAYATVQSDLP